MNVLFISQCSKNALKESRRILDQFAERKGDRSWQTAITWDGLTAVRKLLRKTAKKNTAVACHWIKSAGQTELLWIVGKLNQFNEQGTVPTNTSNSDVIRSKDENDWHNAEVISLAAAIAGLFHDVGKANQAFQEKLTPSAGKKFELFRHEWVSLRIFEAFVGDARDDRCWLQRLGTLLPSAAADKAILSAMKVDAPDNLLYSPFRHFPVLAKLVGWLIVSHHRLPNSQLKNERLNIEKIDQWLIGNNFNASWNALNFQHAGWSQSDLKKNWRFPEGTPIRSQSWCARARYLGQRALKCQTLSMADWMQSNPLVIHLARLSLMLADHYYSSGPAREKWQDQKYLAIANTDQKSRQPKQHLDEHNVGVAHYAAQIVRALPRIKRGLPSISRHKGFTRRSVDQRFRWQDKAADLAEGIAQCSLDQGFFGINMASTGCGKTFANARIMYALADPKLGCRFSVALGLRTLTLQTGDALASKLQLESDDLAVLIGSDAVRQLHHMRALSGVDDGNLANDRIASSGSESAADWYGEHHYVRYEGSLYDGPLAEWLAASPTALNLVSAPVLVSTIDHLMPATEGTRGGRQIAPMLRLMSSDLVLDEPDDFDLADLPALCRLVNWAGMLGARILLSSATLPPALVEALFAAYRQGRHNYRQNCLGNDVSEQICCYWADEYSVLHQDISDLGQFNQTHDRWTSQRVSKLRDKAQAVRIGSLIEVTCTDQRPALVQAHLAGILHTNIAKMHRQHHQCDSGNDHCLSVGLLRFANIDSMVAIARQVLSMTPPDNQYWHFCIYHSHHPLIVRSAIEAQLDQLLNRHDQAAIWQQPSVRQAFADNPDKQHVFIVFGTPVTEVGRDHDYDWAIVEPSSMRSLIQIAGRVQRHRQQIPKTPNIGILNQNYLALTGQSVAYWRPGFESKEMSLQSKDLRQILPAENYQPITAIPRLRQSEHTQPLHNLVDLEHASMERILNGPLDIQERGYAALWWLHACSWCAVLQKKRPFRHSEPQEIYTLMMHDEDDDLQFYRLMDDVKGSHYLSVDRSEFKRDEFKPAQNISSWLEHHPKVLLLSLAEQLDMPLDQICKRFAEVRLRQISEHWYYHPDLGIYQKHL